MRCACVCAFACYGFTLHVVLGTTTRQSLGCICKVFNAVARWRVRREIEGPPGPGAKSKTQKLNKAPPPPAPESDQDTRRLPEVYRATASITHSTRPHSSFFDEPLKTRAFKPYDSVKYGKEPVLYTVTVEQRPADPLDSDS